MDLRRPEAVDVLEADERLYGFAIQTPLLWRQSLAVFPIELPTTLRPIGIAMRAGVWLSPAADAFAKTLRSVAFAISKRKRE
jgi:hypothetical protein